MCGLTVTSWGNPVEGTGDCFHLHCKAGGWDHTGCTVFMDGSLTLFDSDAPPWLVFCDWVISVHYEVLRFAVFLNEKLGLWLFCLVAIVDGTFPSFLAGVSHRDVGIGWVPVPLLGSLELCQLACLQYWDLCLTRPRLAPSQPASLCVFHSFLEWLVRISNGTEVCIHCFHNPPNPDNHYRMLNVHVIFLCVCIHTGDLMWTFCSLHRFWLWRSLLWEQSLAIMWVAHPCGDHAWWSLIWLPREFCHCAIPSLLTKLALHYHLSLPNSHCAPISPYQAYTVHYLLSLPSLHCSPISPYQAYTVHYHLSLPSLHCALPPLLTSLTLHYQPSLPGLHCALPALLPGLNCALPALLTRLTLCTTSPPYQAYTVHYQPSLPGLHCALPSLLTKLTLCTTISPYQPYTALPALLTRLKLCTTTLLTSLTLCTTTLLTSLTLCTTSPPYQPYTVHYQPSLPALHCALPALLTSLTLCTTSPPYQA